MERFLGGKDMNPFLKSKTLEKEKNDTWNVLYLYLGRYFGAMDKTHEILREFNSAQYTLLAYSYLDNQICNGGFIQLIQNGYGKYIFDNSFSKRIKKWGAEETAKIVEEAKKIYKKNKNILETKTPVKNFSMLHEDIKDFERLENNYCKINIQDAKNVKEYVENHIHDFWNNTIKKMISYDDIVEETRNLR
jgi:hypothetical protein